MNSIANIDMIALLCYTIKEIWMIGEFYDEYIDGNDEA